MSFWSEIKKVFSGAQKAFDDIYSKTSGGNNSSGLFGALKNDDKVNAMQLQEAERNRQFQQQSANFAYQRSKESMNTAYNLQRTLRQTAYQDTMQDLEKAGLNPVLAAQLGPSSTSSVPTAQSFSASGSQANLTDQNTEGELLSQLLGTVSSALLLSLIKGGS